MSCGKPHEVDCSEVLERVYLFIDGEMGPEDVSRIAHHLDECAPCLRSVDVERMLKALVARSCRESAPEAVRSRVLLRLEHVGLRISNI